jgi:hypothetical protein
MRLEDKLRVLESESYCERMLESDGRLRTEYPHDSYLWDLAVRCETFRSGLEPKTQQHY